MKKVLFVCLGNICRSPAAEGIFNHLIVSNKLESQISCDSAGTSDYHVGNPSDERMISHAKKRNYSLLSVSRAFDPHTDFDQFDLILAMDESVLSDLLRMDYQGQYKDKLKSMVSYCKLHSVKEVPDPYLTGPEGFEYVLDILEDSCGQLIKSEDLNLNMTPSV